MKFFAQLSSFCVLVIFLVNPVISITRNGKRRLASSSWDLSQRTMQYNGKSVVVHGFAVTCLEYFLRGIGMECFSSYKWDDASNIITNVNTDQVNALLSVLEAEKQHTGVVPAVRFSLNAGYYLDVETLNWKENREKYPDLSNQYRTLIDSLVSIFTEKNVLVILDLHWNDDATEQQAMALKGTSTTGDSVEFWNQLSQKYGSNDLVWYELYNEPFVNSYDIWLNGNTQYEGMKNMYDAIRQNTNNPIVIAGKANYAYDADSLVKFESEVKPANVVYNLHPYMGPLQQNDQSKSITGFKSYVDTLKAVNKPIILTEFGQYCCSADGACYLYSGVYNGEKMGYVEALLSIAKEESISWTAWAYRPQKNSGGASCNQPDANDGMSLYDADNYNGVGASWKKLYPKFFLEEANKVTTTTTTTSKLDTTTSISTSTPKVSTTASHKCPIGLIDCSDNCTLTKDSNGCSICFCPKNNEGTTTTPQFSTTTSRKCPMNGLVDCQSNCILTKDSHGCEMCFCQKSNEEAVYADAMDNCAAVGVTNETKCEAKCAGNGYWLYQGYPYIECDCYGPVYNFSCTDAPSNDALLKFSFSAVIFFVASLIF